MVAAALLAGRAALAAEAEDSDWPCIQRLVPQLSAGMVWVGPPIEEVGGAWRDRPGVHELVAKIAPLGTPVEKAQKAVQVFAETLGDQKDAVLTLVFAGLFSTINQERNWIIEGIKKYARRQRALAEKISRKSRELDQLRKGGTPESEAKWQELKPQLDWDLRIFDERDRSLKFLCEQPVLLEQRLFLLAREIMANIE